MNTKNPVISDSIFANIFSYMGQPISREIDDADLFVVGLPYDLATSGRSGTRGGPGGIRQASANLRWEENRSVIHSFQNKFYRKNINKQW